MFVSIPSSICARRLDMFVWMQSAKKWSREILTSWSLNGDQSRLDGNLDYERNEVSF